MLYEIIGCLVAVLVIAALVYAVERQGRQSEQNDQMKQVLDDIHAATVVRDRLRGDAVFAKRVRDLFTR